MKLFHIDPFYSFFSLTDSNSSYFLFIRCKGASIEEWQSERHNKQNDLITMCFTAIIVQLKNQIKSVHFMFLIKLQPFWRITAAKKTVRRGS